MPSNTFDYPIPLRGCDGILLECDRMLSATCRNRDCPERFPQAIKRYSDWLRIPSAFAVPSRIDGIACVCDIDKDGIAAFAFIPDSEPTSPPIPISVSPEGLAVRSY